MKNPKLTYMKEGKTISSELDEKTLNDILQSVLLAKPELSEYDAIKYLFYGFTPIPTNSITRFEFSFIDDMGFKCTIEKANNNNTIEAKPSIKRETEMETIKKEEFTRVVRVSDSKYNFIGKNGKLLFDEWYDWLGDFYDGFARVRRSDNLYNFINKDGKLLSDTWFDWADDFHNGFAKVQKANGEWAKIDKTGKIVSE